MDISFYSGQTDATTDSIVSTELGKPASQSVVIGSPMDTSFYSGQTDVTTGNIVSTKHGSSDPQATVLGYSGQTAIHSGQTDVTTASIITTQHVVVPTEAAITNKYTLNGQVITQVSQSDFFVDGKTLAIGSTLTAGVGPTAEPVVLETADGQTVIIVGDASSTLIPPPTSASHPLPLLTLGTITYTADDQTEYVIAGQTLRPGGSAIEVSGTLLSLIPEASEIVVDGSTTIVETVGLGGYIMSGFDVNPQSTITAHASGVGSGNGTGLVTFTSSGAKRFNPPFCPYSTARVMLLVVSTLVCAWF